MRRTAAFAACLAMAATLVAGCGSSNGSSNGSSTQAGTGAGSAGSGGDAGAKALVARSMQADTAWTGPTSSPPLARGKFVIVVPCIYSAPGCARPADAFIEAAKSAGWRTQLIDPAGDPNKLQAAYEKALQLHADGVFASSTETEQVRGILPQLRKAGIALVTEQASRASNPTPTTWQANIYHHNYDENVALAAYVALHSGGNARIALIQDSEYAADREATDGFKAGLKQYCPHCQIVTSMDFSVADLATTVGPRVKALLQANPSVDWVYGPYDAASTVIVNAIDQAGLAGRVKLVSWQGDPQNLGYIKAGHIEVASYANCLEWEGYAGFDQMNRVFQGKPVVADERTGSKLIDASNVPADTSRPWSCDIDFRAEFQRIWKAGKG